MRIVMRVGALVRARVRLVRRETGRGRCAARTSVMRGDKHPTPHAGPPRVWHQPGETAVALAVSLHERRA